MLQVEIIGHLGADAEVKEYNGKKFITFSVAHTETNTDSQGGTTDRTIWLRCVRGGESKVFDYLTKGQLVFIRGRLSTRIYYNSANAPQVGLSCQIQELQLLGGNAKSKDSSEDKEVQDPE